MMPTLGRKNCAFRFHPKILVAARPKPGFWPLPATAKSWLVSATQLPPLASGIDSPAVGGLTGQPIAVRGDQLPSLPGTPPARDPAFLPRDFVLVGARLTLAASGGGDEQAPATSGGSNNNAASDTNNANEQVTVMQVADLALTKQVNPTHQMEGFDVTYTFILHNNGPSPATNVTVTDPFPGVTAVGPNTPLFQRHRTETG
jgi:uncharacterized repeat protein (TIGR01451 family)